MFSFILVFIVPLSPLFSNEYYKGDALVKEGVYAFYNYDWDSISKLNIILFDIKGFLSKDIDAIRL